MYALPKEISFDKAIYFYCAGMPLEVVLFTSTVGAWDLGTIKA